MPTPFRGSLAAAKVASTGAHGVTTAHDVSATSLLVQMVIGLVVVIALIKIASRLLEGRAGRGIRRARSQKTITVLGRQSLGKGVQVAVVTADDKTFVLGVTQQQVTVLGHPVPCADGEAAPDSAGDAGHGEGVLQLLRAEGGGSPAEGSGTEDVSAWRSTLEQMRAKTVRRA